MLWSGRTDSRHDIPATFFLKGITCSTTAGFTGTRRACTSWATTPGTTPIWPGSIILGHHTGPSDRLIWTEHLDAFISVLRADGLTFTTVSKPCRLR